MSMGQVVRDAVAQLELAPADLAAAELAYLYADQLDADPTKAGQLGPKLHALLDDLLMTPKARSVAARPGGRDGVPTSPLDELRARRAARTDRTPPLDAAAPCADPRDALRLRRHR